MTPVGFEPTISTREWPQSYAVDRKATRAGGKVKLDILITVFFIDNANLMYNAHPNFFGQSFWCIDNAHDAN
jgi:hypothetical protein